MNTYKLFGPPGTGKTTELLNILDHELKSGVPVEEIAYVSFTKEGVNQGKNRALAMMEYKGDDLPYFRTLHSLAFRELKVRRAQVMDKTQYKYFSKKMGMHFTGYYTEELRNDDDKYLFLADLMRNNARAVEPLLTDIDMQKLDFVARQYKVFKDTFALLDFTDMIDRFVQRNTSVPVRVAIVDEAQDLTTLQWQMVFAAFGNAERLYIAGDDDQAIYQWSGADVTTFLGIQGDQRVLHHSYRLPDAILSFAKSISAQITERVEKQYTGIGGDSGAVVWCNSVDDVPINPAESYMYLSRNNCFLNDIEETIAGKGKMYRRKGQVSATHNEMQIIKKYEHVRKTRIMDTETENALQNNLREGYSLNAPWYESFNWPDVRLMYFRDLIANKTDLADIKIDISTIHAVKGGEADNVILLTDITRNVALNLTNNPDSEHRVFYVGATRAKKKLYVVHSANKYGYAMREDA